MPIHDHFFSAGDFDQCDHGSLVDLCMQDYKSLCAAATIRAILVSTHRHRQINTDRILTSLHEQVSQVS